MARWNLFVGGSPNPIATGDDTNDPSALILQDPAGTSIWTLGHAGGQSRVNLGTATAETQAASTTIDVTKTLHRIATDGANFSGASNFVASAGGSDGDVLIIHVKNAASNGTTTVTFSTHFKPSATLAVLQGDQATVMFVSDGTNWNEVNRSAIFAS